MFTYETANVKLKSSENFLSPKNGQNLAVFGVWGLGVRKVSIFTAKAHLQCAAKKYPLKFFAIFLATARNFYMKFHVFTCFVLLIHSHIKLLSSIVLFLIMTELLNFLGDHVVVSDVHGMFAERKTHHIL